MFLYIHNSDFELHNPYDDLYLPAINVNIDLYTHFSNISYGYLKYDGVYTNIIFKQHYWMTRSWIKSGLYKKTRYIISVHTNNGGYHYTGKPAHCIIKCKTKIFMVQHTFLQNNEPTFYIILWSTIKLHNTMYNKLSLMYIRCVWQLQKQKGNQGRSLKGAGGGGSCPQNFPTTLYKIEHCIYDYICSTMYSRLLPVKMLLLVNDIFQKCNNED